MKEYIEGDCPKCGLPLEVLEIEHGAAKGCKIFRCNCGYEYIYETELWKNTDKSGLIKDISDPKLF